MRFVHKIFFVFVLSCFVTSLCAREGFRVHLGPYFTERQGGNIVQLEIDYSYEGILERLLMPDYREIQNLVEEILYGEEDIDIYWELVNRELVRRILVSYPQLPDVRSSFLVHPRRHLVISRSSEVHWSQDDLAELGREGDYRIFPPYGLMPGRINIMVPRIFAESVMELKEELDNTGSDYLIDFSIHQLEGNHYLLEDALATAGPGGPWAGIILPEGVAEGWIRGPEVGTIQQWSKITHPDPKTEGMVLESGIRYFLGMNHFADEGIEIFDLPLAEARERFFLGDFKSTIYPNRYIGAYRALGWKIESFGEDISLFVWFHPEKVPDQIPDTLN